MKKITIVLCCLIGVLSLQNCSSVKVLDAWKSDTVSSVKDNNFLVIARTSDKQARIAFENEIVSSMGKSGFSATPSFSKFASMNPERRPTEDEVNQFIDMIKKEGFNGIVLTVLKDYQEETRVTTDGGYYAGGNYYGYYPRYYGGFYGYYRHPMSMSTLGNYVEPTTTTSTSKIYVVETTVYDLDKTGEEQLVAVVTSKLDNPESASEIARDYVNKITKSLK
ncbi:hypothetical protein J4050_00170 [Winogradskyella sp. DF17]|uniref:DUF4136 domain-containing protein n=1 Tax=Winogradskyella pelagia TaxID=2819984 RepID=A0ABS3SXD0_9FLAO|nr:hypothetical protein [Winogradskyella sp. DF17]MBO3115138.1 hypothetical protein [Winogradskyella sp. DF17]